MKLRNFAIVAALFLTAGIASAAVVHEDVYNIEPGEATADNPRVKIGEDVRYVIPSNMFYINNHITDTTSEMYGQTYAKILVDLKNPQAGYTYELYGMSPMYHHDNFWHQTINEGTKEVYIPEAAGNIALVVNGTAISSYDASISHMPGGDMGFGPGFSHEGRQTIVFNDGNGNTSKVTFGSPLPTPVVTLLIALGFGAAFVMYRNRKQVKA